MFCLEQPVLDFDRWSSDCRRPPSAAAQYPNGAASTRPDGGAGFLSDWLGCGSGRFAFRARPRRRRPRQPLGALGMLARSFRRGTIRVRGLDADRRLVHDDGHEVRERGRPAVPVVAGRERVGQSLRRLRSRCSSSRERRPTWSAGCAAGAAAGPVSSSRPAPCLEIGRPNRTAPADAARFCFRTSAGTARAR